MTQNKNTKKKKNKKWTKLKKSLISDVVLPFFLSISFIYVLIKNKAIFRTNDKKLAADRKGLNEKNESILPIDWDELTFLSQTNINAFYLKFVEVFPDLYDILIRMQPQLSDSEIKFCMHLRMGYSTKEIAIYTNSSIKSVESKKYRLRRKLNDSSNVALLTTLNLLNNK